MWYRGREVRKWNITAVGVDGSLSYEYEGKSSHVDQDTHSHVSLRGFESLPNFCFQFLVKNSRQNSLTTGDNLGHCKKKRKKTKVKDGIKRPHQTIMFFSLLLL